MGIKGCIGSQQMERIVRIGCFYIVKTACYARPMQPEKSPGLYNRWFLGHRDLGLLLDAVETHLDHVGTPSRCHFNAPVATVDYEGCCPNAFEGVPQSAARWTDVEGLVRNPDIIVER